MADRPILETGRVLKTQDLLSCKVLKVKNLRTVPATPTSCCTNYPGTMTSAPGYADDGFLVGESWPLGRPHHAVPWHWVAWVDGYLWKRPAVESRGSRQLRDERKWKGPRWNRCCPTATPNFLPT